MRPDADTLAGFIFLLFGSASLMLGLGYGFGSLRALGSGALPILLGSALLILGAILVGRSALAALGGAARVEVLARREAGPLLFILGGVAAFALLVGRVGLVPSLAVLMTIGWFADRRGRLIELPILIIVAAALIVAIFNWGLGLPFRLFAWRF